ncbi:2-dehydropantoate 2-reductase [Falsiroseomonas selenitidurans]|uniref:2-dehydropantoate 2-reductase n=1 Tax=Falsiroseomonas selenitidurans TaxID=2716335 RepID=A0ABX1E415_9PROT|nr:2-dehydropantoate 2-reductase [Falsiroseomonas selenitidurans]NKC30507.1 2-dehydropantoate 2-reductase [Falsiroseomonas selenitidurans]OYW10788.1 MAG: 2-dehydropantoate 2-reductase [Rhodospirillales bacterium 12-71-4]
MRMLVLGAGALGGYFGGRALERGLDVTFLVRPGRAAALARDGLRVRSTFGDIDRPVATTGRAGPGFDVVLLSCKAYDLDSAIEAIRPAVEAGACVLPILNGMAHIATLNAAFGPQRVWGGLAKCAATLTPDGVVQHLGDWHWLTFGDQDGRLDGRAGALAAALGQAPGLVAEAVPDIERRMWEKLVHLGTVAAGTVLMRASVGEIVRAGGGAFLLTLLERNAAIAAARGHAMTDAFLSGYRTLFTDPASPYTASMLRDLEAGGRTEADHILGFLADAARRAGVDPGLHDLAHLHARAFDQRRDAGRLP